MERKYKDSGIEWIGKIPETWETTKIASLYTQRNEKVSDKDYAPLSVTMQGILPQLETAAKTDDGDNRKLVKKGDFAINSRSDRRGSCGISPYDGSVSLINTILKPRGEMNPNFYNWLFHTSPFADEFYKWGHGIVDDLWTTRWQEMKNIFVVNPSMNDQQLIADYLDKKCGEIDSLIALQEQMIEKLKAYKQSVITEAVTKGLDPNAKLVPSGIDWIGTIPEGWSLAKMDYICSVITDFVASGSFESLRKNVPYIDSPDYAMLVRTADLSGSAKSDKRVYISKHSYDFLKNSNLFGGEIVLPNIGASVGDVYMVPESLYNKMSLGPNSIMLKTKYYDKYYYYYFLGEPGRRSVINMCQATAQPKFNKTQLRGLQVVMPPITIQKEIVLFLDEKCTDIDRLITLKQQKIESLKEYKKSVIYEAVTGKTIIE